MFNKVPHRVLVQVWIALELARIRKAKLILYTFNLDSHNRHVKRYGTIELNWKTSIFRPDIVEKLVNRYSHFLLEYL